jgi:hypothetical protein
MIVSTFSGKSIDFWYGRYGYQDWSDSYRMTRVYTFVHVSACTGSGIHCFTNDRVILCFSSGLFTCVPSAVLHTISVWIARRIAATENVVDQINDIVDIDVSRAIGIPNIDWVGRRA